MFIADGCLACLVLGYFVLTVTKITNRNNVERRERFTWGQSLSVPVHHSGGICGRVHGNRAGSRGTAGLYGTGTRVTRIGSGAVTSKGTS